MKNRLKLKYFSDELQYSVQKKVIFEGGQYPNGRKQMEIEGVVNLLFENENSVKVRKTDFLFDGKRFFDNPVDQFFTKSSEVMNDLHLALTEDGLLKSVRNRDDVQRKWSHCKIYLERFFVSDEVDAAERMNDYIVQLDDVVSDESQFFKAVERDLFYAIFFRGYYQDFGSDGSLFRTSRWDHLLGGTRIVVSEEWTVSNENDYDLIRMVGHLNKKESDIHSFSRSMGCVEDLDVCLGSEAFFDRKGLPVRIDFKIEVNVPSCCFKQIGVCIKRK